MLEIQSKAVFENVFQLRIKIGINIFVYVVPMTDWFTSSIGNMISMSPKFIIPILGSKRSS